MPIRAIRGSPLLLEFVTLAGVSTGGAGANVAIPLAVLLGDTNNDRVVNSGDAQQTRNRSGQTADETNFRSDVNTDGTVNSGDATIVRSRSANSITEAGCPTARDAR